MPAGKYGLHDPEPGFVDRDFLPMAEGWGSYTYNETEDALRVTVKPQPGSFIFMVVGCSHRSVTGKRWRFSRQGGNVPAAYFRSLVAGTN